MNGVVPRGRYLERIERAIRRSPVTAILGPRQCGKTHLARSLGISGANYFDLHNRVDAVRLDSDPVSALGRLSGTVVVDEVQLRPELFGTLRVLADRPDVPARFLILGSASPMLLKQASDSLAGRIRFIDLGGLHLGEVGAGRWRDLWLQGGFPRSFLDDLEGSEEWRADYLRVLVERDLREIVETKMTAEQLRKLLFFVAHSHGQAWNHSAAGEVLGVNYKTIQRHMEILKGAGLILELPPFAANVKKRLRKAPRYYVRDSGLLHSLLAVVNHEHLVAHPRMGASWEGFCIEQIVKLRELRLERCSCYSVQSGTEVDLVVQTSGGLEGYEFKASSAPSITRSMREAMNDLALMRLYVVHPGEKSFEMDDRIEAIGIEALPERFAAR